MIESHNNYSVRQGSEKPFSSIFSIVFLIAASAIFLLLAYVVIPGYLYE